MASAKSSPRTRQREVPAPEMETLVSGFDGRKWHGKQSRLLLSLSKKKITAKYGHNHELQSNSFSGFCIKSVNITFDSCFLSFLVAFSAWFDTFPGGGGSVGDLGRKVAHK